MTQQQNIPELVATAKREPLAFAELYDHFSIPIYRYLFSRVGHRSDAEDLTAQTFLTALEKLPLYRERGYFKAWLFTIACNKARDYFRRKRPEIGLEEMDKPSSHSDLLTKVIQTEQIQELSQLIKTLKENEQELLRLRYVAELSFEDMAAVLGKRTDAVKKSLYRLQDRLQRKMEVHND